MPGTVLALRMSGAGGPEGRDADEETRRGARGGVAADARTEAPSPPSLPRRCRAERWPPASPAPSAPGRWARSCGGLPCTRPRSYGGWRGEAPWGPPLPHPSATSSGGLHEAEPARGGIGQASRARADGAARSLARVAATPSCSSRRGRKELPRSARGRSRGRSAGEQGRVGVADAPLRPASVRRTRAAWRAGRVRAAAAAATPAPHPPLAPGTAEASPRSRAGRRPSSSGAGRIREHLLPLPPMADRGRTAANGPGHARASGDGGGPGRLPRHGGVGRRGEQGPPAAAPSPALAPSSFLSLSPAPPPPPPQVLRLSRLRCAPPLSRARRPGRRSSSSCARADGDGGAPAAYLPLSFVLGDGLPPWLRVWRGGAGALRGVPAALGRRPPGRI